MTPCFLLELLGCYGICRNNDGGKRGRDDDELKYVYTESPRFDRSTRRWSDQGEWCAGELTWLIAKRDPTTPGSIASLPRRGARAKNAPRGIASRRSRSIRGCAGGAAATSPTPICNCSRFITAITITTTTRLTAAIGSCCARTATRTSINGSSRNTAEIRNHPNLSRRRLRISHSPI